MAVKLGPDSLTIPVSTSDPSVGQVDGDLYLNSTLNTIRIYSTSSGWQDVFEPVPEINNVSGTIFTDRDSTITVSGDLFRDGAIVSVTGDAVGNTDRALTTTFVSDSELTAATNAGTVSYANSNFGIKVTNPSGKESTLVLAGNVDSPVAWTTAAGTVATINDSYNPTGNNHVTLSATDGDGDSISYSIVSGSLPAGLSLNSSTGLISGEPSTGVTDSTTYSFTARATTPTAFTDRNFNIIVKPSIVTNGLLLYWDAAYGSSVTDRFNSYNGSLSNVTHVNSGLSSYWNNPTNSSGYILGNDSIAIRDLTTVMMLESTEGLHGIIGRNGVTDKSLRYSAEDQSFAARNPGDGNDWAYPSATTFYNNGVATNALQPTGSWQTIGGAWTNSQFSGSWRPRWGSSMYQGRYWNGRMAALLLYNRTLTAAEQLQNYRALGWRYGI